MSEQNEIRVGPFVLEQAIARGAAGHVCRAHHAGSETPVALKMLTSEAAQKPGVARALRREVESMAKLHHPGIAAVLDTGVVDEDLELESGDVIAGTPWIAMEFVGGEPLSRYYGQLSWPVFQRFLYDLLDALAYAHAQGIVHRDIKPDNILVVRDGARYHPKLVDFGIAKALDEPDENAGREGGERKVTGTPKYMAPEQILGRWRDQGPPTDLYSVGCVAWRFVTGRAPFVAGSTIKTLESHLHDSLPRFLPSMRVPAGLEDWLGSLLVKHPVQRIQRAATASRTLMELPRKLEPLSEDVQAAAPADMSSDSLLSASEPTLPSSVSSLKQINLKSSAGRADALLPALPDSWEALTPPRPPVQLAGAGLALYGLRTVPVVGRRLERNALWAALTEAVDTGERRSVWLTGDAGAGKSRLAQWITQRAHAAGAFEVLKAVHGSDGGGPMDGLGSMLARYFGCVGLSQDEMQERLEEYFEVRGWTDRVSKFDRGVYLEMMQAVGFESDETRTSAEFRSVQEKYLAIDRLFERITEQRPLVLWIDDAQYSPETLGLISFLGRRADDEPLPVLMLVTARRGDLKSHAVRQAYEDCRKSEGARHLDISGLADDEMHELVTRLLGLEERLARRVVERADGRPLFAVQIVDDWVERDELEATPNGFRLRSDADVQLPDDIHHMWLQRLERLIGAMSPDAQTRENGWRVLETAAFLGQEVATREWLACCGQAGLTIPRGLVEALSSRNLAARSEQGWTFTHALLRESLERFAEEEGRARTHHYNCAEGLINLYGPKSARLAFRRAVHLTKAERFEDALDAISGTAYEFLLRGEPERASEAQRLHEDIIEKLDLPAESEARVSHWNLKATLLRLQGEVDEAHPLAGKAMEVAEKHGYEELHARTLNTYGHCLLARGEFEESIQYLEDSARMAEKLRVFDLQGQAYRYAALARKWCGDHEIARNYVERALDAHRRAGNTSNEALMRAALAGHDKNPETIDVSIEETRKALRAARETGDRRAMANISNTLAELYRFDKQLERASDYYEEAYDHWRACGSTDRYVAMINLMLVELARGDFDRVHELTEELIGVVREREAKYLSFVALGHAAALSARGDYELARERTTEGIEAVVHADPDLLVLTEHILEQAGARGWDDICEDIRELERDQREQLAELLNANR
jgi:serine/threonine protein kinase/tetratricopeptide (TPR) repeat protein